MMKFTDIYVTYSCHTYIKTQRESVEADAVADKINIIRVSSLCHLVTLPLSPLENYGLMLILNIEDMTHVAQSISQVTKLVNNQTQITITQQQSNVM